MSAEDFAKVMNVNVNGLSLTCKAVAKGMRERGYEKMINVASVAGIKADPAETLDAVGYSTSKGALIQLTRDLAMTWGPYGIRVHALAPGFVPTRMTEKLLPKIIYSFNHKNALGRPGSPDAIAGCVVLGERGVGLCKRRSHGRQRSADLNKNTLPIGRNGTRRSLAACGGAYQYSRHF